MKLISRYLLANLVRPWLYILFGFTAIAVLVDLFDNFVTFMEAGTPIGAVLLYYAAFVPTYLPFMLPISLLLALLYALWRLGKNSEITAMRASGLSLWQLSRPYLALGLGCSLALLAINERFNPWAARWTRFFRDVQDDGEKACLVPVAYKNTVARRVWRINTFDIRPENGYEMSGVSLTQQRPDGSDEYRIDADRARWINGHWWFEKPDIHRFTALGHPVGAAEKRAAMDMTMLTETPDDFLNETKKIENNESSTSDIRAFILGHPDISDHTRASLWVDWNYRLAAPWLCIIVILVGIPFGMQTGRRGMGMGILAALLIFFGYYVLMGSCLGVGKNKSLYDRFSFALANHDGTVKYEGLHTATNRVLNKTGMIGLYDKGGRELERHAIPFGAKLTVHDGDNVQKGKRIAEWDTYYVPILSEFAGKVDFRDFIAGTTVVPREVDEATGKEGIVALDPRGGIHPQVLVRDPKDPENILATYTIPAGAHVVVAKEDEIGAYDDIAKIPKTVLTDWWLSVRCVLVPILAGWAPPLCFLVLGLLMLRRCR